MNNIESTFEIVSNDKALKKIADAYKDNEKTKVLIFCYVYNHEKYIAQCLDSMLTQQVNFNVRIIIHNDNSSDLSLKIIEEYERQYPKIIKVISQEKNLYDGQHGLLHIFKFLRQYHDGEYIAICEGDDYWSNPYKLAFQAKIMDTNSSLHFCTHKVAVLDDTTKTIIRYLPADRFKLKSQLLNSKKFISLTSIRYPFQTSSYFFRTDDFSTYLDNLPKFAEIMPTEDESLLLYFGHLGDSAFLNKALSTYRKFSIGSWSNEHKDSSNDCHGNNRLKKMINAIKEFDAFTHYKFHKQCQSRIVKHEFRILMNEKNIDEIFNNHQYRRYFKKQYPKEFYSILFRRVFRKK